MKILPPFRVLLLLFASFFLFSCSQQDLSTAIPKEAFAVGVFNVKDISEKADAEALASGRIARLLKEELRNESRDLSQQIDEWSENPSSIGLDLRKDIYAFGIAAPRSRIEFGLLIPVYDAEALQQSLEQSLRDARVQYTELEGKSYHAFVLEGKALIGWDDKKLLALATMGRNYDAEGLQDLFEDYFTLKPERSLAQVASFSAFLDNKEDLSVWLAPEAMPAEVRTDFDQLSQELPFDWYGAAIEQHLAFNRDNATYTASLFPNESMKEYWAENDFMEEFESMSLLDNLPQEYMIAASAAFDPAKLYASIKDELGNTRDFQRFTQKFQEEMGYDFEELVSSFSGEAAFSLFGMEEKTFSDKRRRYGSIERTWTEMVPTMGLVFSLEEDNRYRSLMNKMVEEEGGDIQQYGDYFHINAGSKEEMFVAKNENLVLISNSEAQVDAFLDGGYDEGLDGDVQDELAQRGMAVTWNLDKSLYPEEVLSELAGRRGRDASRLFPDLFRSLSLSQAGTYSYQLVLEMKGTDQNSLASILEFLDRNSSEYLQ